jgi:hypothetical protein
MTEPSIEPNVTNKAVEEAAVRFVFDYERRAGRDPRDSRAIPGAPGDLISGDRLIEIKAAGTSSRGFELWLEPVQYQAALDDPAFHLYLVENVRQGDPALFRLLDLHGEQLRGLVERAKHRSYYTVPFGSSAHDVAPWVIGLPPASTPPQS